MAEGLPRVPEPLSVLRYPPLQPSTNRLHVLRLRRCVPTAARATSRWPVATVLERCPPTRSPRSDPSRPHPPSLPRPSSLSSGATANKSATPTLGSGSAKRQACFLASPRLVRLSLLLLRGVLFLSHSISNSNNNVAISSHQHPCLYRLVGAFSTRHALYF